MSTEMGGIHTTMSDLACEAAKPWRQESSRLGSTAGFFVVIDWPRKEGAHPISRERQGIGLDYVAGT